MINEAVSEDSRITFIEGMPGSNKTGEVLKIIADDEQKYMYLGYSHEFLDEVSERLGVLRVPHTRWYGLSLTCESYLLEEKDALDKYITFLINNSVSPNVVCRVCEALHRLQDVHTDFKSSNCLYKKQFTNTERVILAPIQYLNTIYVKEFDPDIVVLDDVTLATRALTPLSKLRIFLKIHRPQENLEDLLSYLHNLDKDELKKWVEANKKELVKMLSDYPEIMAPEMLLDPRVFAEWAEVWDVAAGNEEWETPIIIDALKLLNENSSTNMIIIDAQIPHEIMDMLERQTNLHIETSRKVLRSNPKTKSIYRLVSSRLGKKAFSMSTTQDANWVRSTKIKMLELAKLALKPLDQMSVGIISHKDQNYYRIWGEQNFRELLFEHYGNVKGKNDMRLVDALFLLGTYTANPTAIVKKFTYFFLRKPSSEVLAERHWDESGLHFADPELEEFKKWLCDYELYQAIHRARPIDRVVSIFCFSAIPKLISEEFEIKNIQVVKTKIGYDIVPLGDARLSFFVSCLPNTIESLSIKLSEKYDISKRQARNLINDYLENDELYGYHFDTQKVRGSTGRNTIMISLFDPWKIDNEDR